MAESASMAKNVTVNFNRKGELTPQLGALYLFFNPVCKVRSGCGSRYSAATPNTRRKHRHWSARWRAPHWRWR